MNAIDLFFIIPLAWFAYKGFTKGLIIELATFLALLAGIYIASRFSDYTSNFLTNNLDIHNKYMHIISFTITFLLVIVLVILFGKSIEKVIKVMMLSALNKIAGAIFGIIKISFILSIIILIFNKFDLEEKIINKNLRTESLLYEPVKKIAPAVFPVLIKGKNKLMENIKIEGENPK